MGTDLAVTKTNSVAAVRHGFGEQEVDRASVGNTVAQAIAQREQAIVQARYIVAMQRPRRMQNIRVAMLDECKRKGFAEVARYHKPVGRDKSGEMQYAEGFSIRFAEMAIRHMGNLDLSAMPIHEDDMQRVVLMAVTDLETNASYQKPIALSKTVERRKLKQGQEAIGTRKNTYGDTVYIVEATNDEVNMREAAEWSKFIRNALRFVPGDILDDCLAQVNRTVESMDDVDPNTRKHAMVDRFREDVGVMPNQIEEYLGHSLDRPLTDIEYKALRNIYGTIRAGEGSWQEFLDEKAPTGTVEDAEKAASSKLASLLRPTEKPRDSAPSKPEAPKVPTITAHQVDALLTFAAGHDVSEKDVAAIAKHRGFNSLLDVTVEGRAEVMSDIEHHKIPGAAPSEAARGAGESPEISGEVTGDSSSQTGLFGKGRGKK